MKRKLKVKENKKLAEEDPLQGASNEAAPAEAHMPNHLVPS
jgi:hypothetical protein